MPARSTQKHRMSLSGDDVRQRFERAVETFVERVKQDPYVLAVVLFGSLSYDTVWEKSDVDLMLVGPEAKGARGKQPTKFLALTEGGVNIHATLQSRSDFRRMIEGSLGSSFAHSMFSKSKLLFTRDETIRELYDNVHAVGSRDQQVQLLRAATNVLPVLYKAQKWLHVKKDLDYSFLWIMHCVSGLAHVEVCLDGQVAGREVIQQAMELNPEFFRSIYSDLINKKKRTADIATALDRIDAYLSKKTRTLFAPVLEYLANAGAPRSATEIETHFSNQMNISGAVTTCEWLADKGVIEKLALPLRLTERSPVTVDELAFYYDAEDGDRG